MQKTRKQYFTKSVFSCKMNTSNLRGFCHDFCELPHAHHLLRRARHARAARAGGHPPRLPGPRLFRPLLRILRRSLYAKGEHPPLSGRDPPPAIRLFRPDSNSPRHRAGILQRRTDGRLRLCHRRRPQLAARQRIPLSRPYARAADCHCGRLVRRRLVRNGRGILPPCRRSLRKNALPRHRALRPH